VLDRSEVGFSNIVEAMGTQPKTSRQRHPLFDIEIDYRAANINADPDKLQLNGIQTEKFEKGKPNAGKFDFDFLFTERENEISLEVYYKSNLYKRETAERLLNNFMTIVSEVLENPTLKMNESASKLDNSSLGNTLEEKRKSRLLKAKLKSGSNSISPEIRNPEFEGETLVDRLARDASDLKNDLAEKKIILYRGFPLESEAEFQNAVNALGDPPFTYIEKSSLRKQLKQGIYTSTEHPKEQEIHLHCEHSYSAQWPLRLIFACLIPAPQGGATTLADAQAVVDALPEASIERFKREGVLYVRNFGGKLGMNWPQVFLTEDKAEVEQYCAAHGIKFEWWGDNNLRTFSKRPAFRKHPVTGEQLWFNHSFFFNPRSLDDDLYRDLIEHCDKDSLPFNTYYGDGQEIEAEIFSKMKSALNQTKTPHYWEQGDFLLIDNLQIAHGRMPFEGDRKIVLAMTQMNTDHLKLSGVNF
jgi:alpha-ketoglutarate-dependent taurine dioxygenase